MKFSKTLGQNAKTKFISLALIAIFVVSAILPIQTASSTNVPSLGIDISNLTGDIAKIDPNSATATDDVPQKSISSGTWSDGHREVRYSFVCRDKLRTDGSDNFAIEEIAVMKSGCEQIDYNTYRYYYFDDLYLYVTSTGSSGLNTQDGFGLIPGEQYREAITSSTEDITRTAARSLYQVTIDAITAAFPSEYWVVSSAASIAYAQINSGANQPTTVMNDPQSGAYATGTHFPNIKTDFTRAYAEGIYVPMVPAEQGGYEATANTCLLFSTIDQTYSAGSGGNIVDLSTITDLLKLTNTGYSFATGWEGSKGNYITFFIPSEEYAEKFDTISIATQKPIDTSKIPAYVDMGKVYDAGMVGKKINYIGTSFGILENGKMTSESLTIQKKFNSTWNATMSIMETLASKVQTSKYANSNIVTLPIDAFGNTPIYAEILSMVLGDNSNSGNPVHLNAPISLLRGPYLGISDIAGRSYGYDTLDAVENAAYAGSYDNGDYAFWFTAVGQRDGSLQSNVIFNPASSNIRTYNCQSTRNIWPHTTNTDGSIDLEIDVLNNPEGILHINPSANVDYQYSLEVPLTTAAGAAGIVLGAAGSATTLVFDTVDTLLHMIPPGYTIVVPLDMASDGARAVASEINSLFPQNPVVVVPLKSIWDSTAALRAAILELGTQNIVVVIPLGTVGDRTEALRRAISELAAENIVVTIPLSHLAALRFVGDALYEFGADDITITIPTGKIYDTTAALRAAIANLIPTANDLVDQINKRTRSVQERVAATVDDLPNANDILGAIDDETKALQILLANFVGAVDLQRVAALVANLKDTADLIGTIEEQTRSLQEKLGDSTNVADLNGILDATESLRNILALYSSNTDIANLLDVSAASTRSSSSSTSEYSATEVAASPLEDDVVLVIPTGSTLTKLARTIAPFTEFDDVTIVIPTGDMTRAAVAALSRLVDIGAFFEDVTVVVPTGDLVQTAINALAPFIGIHLNDVPVEIPVRTASNGLYRLAAAMDSLFPSNPEIYVPIGDLLNVAYTNENIDVASMIDAATVPLEFGNIDSLLSETQNWEARGTIYGSGMPTARMELTSPTKSVNVRFMLDV
jgi:hypothetical protein